MVVNYYLINIMEQWISNIERLCYGFILFYFIILFLQIFIKLIARPISLVNKDHTR